MLLNAAKSNYYTDTYKIGKSLVKASNKIRMNCNVEQSSHPASPIKANKIADIYFPDIYQRVFE